MGTNYSWYKRRFYDPQFPLFHSKVRGIYPSFPFCSIVFCGQPEQQSPQFCKFSFLLFLFTCSSGWDQVFRLYVKIPEEFVCVILHENVGLSIYHFFVYSIFSFLHNCQWITLPIQSCLILYSFCGNCLHSLIMWLMVSSLLTYNVHLMFCCIYSCFEIIGSYIIVIYSLRVFHIGLSWWCFTEVWKTASLLKSPGLFSVFCPFTII